MERFPQTDGPAVSHPPRWGKWAAWVFLCVVAAAFAVSMVLFERAPICVAVFRGGDAPQAFKVSLFLNGHEPLVSEFALTVSQRHELARSILTRDNDTLKGLSRIVGAEGSYVASSDGAVSSLDWPAFFGGGWSALVSDRTETWVCSLTFPERAVLALWAKTPPPAPWSPVAVPLKEKDPLRPLSASSSPRASQADPKGVAVTNVTEVPVETPVVIVSGGEPLKVEIRNGCGITNAADAVARAAKDAGMQVVFVGNAEGRGRFNVPKTFVESRAGVPVALDEFCKRLGIQASEVRENGSLKAGVDVVVTVGKDYRLLRENLRARNKR